jgi:hypothetical protein
MSPQCSKTSHSGSLEDKSASRVSDKTRNRTVFEIEGCFEQRRLSGVVDVERERLCLSAGIAMMSDKSSVNSTKRCSNMVLAGEKRNMRSDAFIHLF